jgi:hypothetical protein
VHHPEGIVVSQQQTFEQTERIAARLEAAAGDPPLLHIVARIEWPIALCGAMVSEPFNPHRTSVGHDRCADCLIALRNRRSRG